jgi:hypothetical protein
VAEPRLRPVHIVSTPPVHDDELAQRIRSLEAERLRPVPPPPPLRVVTPRALPDLDDDPAIRALRAAGQKHRQITELQEKGGRL